MQLIWYLNLLTSHPITLAINMQKEEDKNLSDIELFALTHSSEKKGWVDDTKKRNL